MKRRRSAFDVFMLMFEDKLAACRTNEQAFESACDDWRDKFGFEPPCKTYASFKVRRGDLIRSGVIEL